MKSEGSLFKHGNSSKQCLWAQVSFICNSPIFCEVLLVLKIYVLLRSILFTFMRFWLLSLASRWKNNLIHTQNSPAEHSAFIFQKCNYRFFIPSFLFPPKIPVSVTDIEGNQMFETLWLLTRLGTLHNQTARQYPAADKEDNTSTSTNYLFDATVVGKETNHTYTVLNNKKSIRGDLSVR